MLTETWSRLTGLGLRLTADVLPRQRSRAESRSRSKSLGTITAGPPGLSWRV